MKINFSFALIASVASSATLVFGTTVSYTNAIAADDPVAFWPLNETSGTIAHDVVGTNNGTIVHPAGVGMGLPGVLYASGVPTDTGFYFTNNAVGGGGYITIPYSTNLNTPIFTVEAWLNMPTFPATGAGANMCPISLDNSTGYGWTFNISSANGSNPTLSGWCGAGSGWTVVSSGVAIQSKWAYYAMTFDGTTVSIYTNGVLAGSHSSTYRQVNAGNPLIIGTYENGGSADGSRYYRGGMANVAIYSYTLTPSQVANHYFYGTNSGSTSFATQPASQTNYLGLTAIFNATAIGQPPLYYQWLAGTTGSGVFTNLIVNDQIADVTNATLTVSGLTLGNAADYRLAVTNAFGATTSLVARLTILTNLLPSIVAQPVKQTNFVGLTANFSVAAIGFPTLYYQWQAGPTGGGVYTNLSTNQQIANVKGSTLSISSVNAGNVAGYRVVVTNAYGAVTSSVANLVVRTNISTNTIKLMCIGDSITYIDSCWWRVDLASNLVNDGYNFIMVGRAQGYDGPINQRHHEGYPGELSQGIIDMLPAMMTANLPDVAMLHIGANDMSADAPNKTANNIRKIILGLQAANSNMTIVVSQIIPCKLCQKINELDYLIPQVCLQLQTPSSHIVCADVFSGFDEEIGFGGGNGPHPNADGGRFMCNVYTPIIESIFNGNIPSNPPLLPPWPGPPGFILCSFANTTSPWPLYFPTPVTIAWGVITNKVYKSGNFIFKSNVVGSFTFDNGLGDPAPGYEKFGFYKPSPGSLPVLNSVTQLPNNQVQLQYTGMTNETYTLQVATDIGGYRSQTTILGTNGNSPPWTFPNSATNWVSVASVCTGTNTTFTLVDPNATSNLGYYRIFQGP